MATCKSIICRPFGWALVAALAAAPAARAGLTDRIIGTSAADVAQALGPARILPPGGLRAGGQSATGPAGQWQTTAWVRVDDMLRRQQGPTDSAVLTAGNRGLDLAWRPFDGLRVAPPATPRAIPSGVEGRRSSRGVLRMGVAEGWSTAEYLDPRHTTALTGRTTTARLAYGPIHSSLGAFDLSVTRARASLQGTSTLVGDLFGEEGAGSISMPYHYTEARAVVRSRQGPWRWWLDLGASQASAQIHTSKAAHSLLLPADQDGMGIQVRVARQRGPALWACAAGATSRSGRGRARCNDAPAGTTDSRFGSQYLGIGWRTARAAREYNAELARFQAHVSLRALVRPPADLSPVPGTTVRAQAEARTCTTMARLGMRQAMGHGWQVGAGLLHLRGSARYGAGYQSFGLWGLLPLTDHTSGSHYPGFRLWVLGLGVQRETAASRVALAAAQGFGQAHPQRQAGQAGAGPEQGRTRGGRVIVFSMTRRWQ